MAVELAVERGVAPARWKWAAGDTRPTVATGWGVKDGDLGRDDAGKRYEYDAKIDDWTVTGVDGGTLFVPGNIVPKGSDQIPSASLASAIGLAGGVAGAIPAGAKSAIIQNTGTQSLRYTISGTTVPTATLGLVLAAGATLDYNKDLTTIKFIDGGASGGALDIEYCG